MLGGAIYSIHNDVLNAEPSSPEDAERLVEEIKNRAKVSMKVGNYPEAEALYSKAITVLPSAILYANRSLARLNLTRAQEAREDAEAAITSDSSYAKGYYRKGMACMALHEYDAAIAAFTQGMELEPNDRSFQEQLTKARNAATSQGSQPAAPPSTTTTTRTSEETSRISRSDTKRTKTTSTSTEDSKSTAVEMDEEVSNAQALRGYKVLDDGRKTTYFNKELTEEEKALIGDIAPKKVERIEAEGPTPGVGSAWNYAGTWEERNMTSWAKRRLEDALQEVDVDLPSSDANVRVKSVTEISGDAQITMARGKKKHIYDFTVELQWELEVDEVKAMGTLKIHDVNADGEYEMEVEVDRQSSPSTRSLVDTYVKRSAQGLQPAIVSVLGAFREEFLEK